MIKQSLLAVLLAGISVSALAGSTCQVGNPKSSDVYWAYQWYHTSAEKRAIYREVFFLGEQQILAQVKAQHLQPHQWGVVFDIDDTLLDNSAFAYQQITTCAPFTPNGFSAYAIKGGIPATPGAAHITCDLQKAGGYVTLLTDRDGSYVDPTTHESLLTATEADLKQQGICFDQVILSKSNADWDKNPRFAAVISGHYAKGMVYSNTLPAHKVLAYFGDNIQDMPGLYQAKMDAQNPNGLAYDRFGIEMFSVPNPVYGSWMGNAFTKPQAGA